MNLIRSIAELLYFLSGVTLAVIATYGIQQIKLLKKDIKLRNERASKEKALEFAERYELFVTLYNRFFEESIARKLPSYSGPIGDFSMTSIPRELLHDAHERFKLDWLASVNKLELIAAALVSGVADEQLGFKIIGWSSCATIASIYDIICVARDIDETNPGYQTIVDLYKLWAPRISKAQLLRARHEIEERLAATNDTRIIPIGLE
jgi:hypothetical protein